MSNLVVSNISDGTTSVGTGYVVNGAAKAWDSVQNDGTIIESFNISSVVDDTGTTVGKFIHNLTNAVTTASNTPVQATANGTSGDRFHSVAAISSNQFTTYGFDGAVRTTIPVGATLFGIIA